MHLVEGPRGGVGGRRWVVVAGLNWVLRVIVKGWQLGKGEVEGVQWSARLRGGKDIGVPRTSTLH